MNKIVLILGMHRSGTSFLASWLQRCGLHIGDNLYGKDIGNTEGHYENWDFIDLHRRALNERPYHKDTAPFDFETHARQLVNDHNLIHPQWAWKDPRTCLLLKEWQAIIPDATAIVIYRHYTLVVDSIIRRYKEQVQKKDFLTRLRSSISYNRSKKKLHNAYLSEWVKYNEQIIDYLKKKENKAYIVINLDTLFNSGGKVISYFRDRGIMLEYTDPEKIFKHDLFTTTPQGKFRFSKDLEQQANKILAELTHLQQTNGF